MEIVGVARVDTRTKELIPRLRPGEVAVIHHEDIDEVSAQGFIAARAGAVVNAVNSVSGRYPNRGPLMLVEAGIRLVDQVGPEIMERVTEGDTLTLRAGQLFLDSAWIGSGTERKKHDLLDAMDSAQTQLQAEVERFIENTLEHATRERALFGQVQLPALNVKFGGKVVLVVVRGQGYRDDLRALEAYIRESKPVLVGVDGGADALIESGYVPDLIVGDMDSVTDETLGSGAELLVHAYPDGRAPGMERMRQLGLDAKVIRSPGTSEDVALWVAYEQGAELIVAVGTHSNIIDFLEKGRQGMASTFLVRLKVGPILFDAKGVSKLYQGGPPGNHLVQLAIAASLPFLIILSLSNPVKQWISLLWLRVRLLTGW